MKNLQSFDSLTISNTVGSIGINPDGGYITSWSVINPKTGIKESILYQGKTIKRTGIPVLFPWFGTAEGKRKHGFGRESVWTVTKKNTSSVDMELSEKDIGKEAQAEYPYSFRATISVNLELNGSMQYKLMVRNTGAVDIPISPGLHPYWAIDQAAKKNMSIEGIKGFSAGSIDWEKSPPDTEFVYSQPVTVCMPQWNVTIEDVSKHRVIKYIVVWSQPITMDDFNYVCVEPVVGYNNALFTEPVFVKPGSFWNMCVRFSVVFTG